MEFLIDACHVQRGIKALGFTYGRAKFMRMADGAVPISSPAKLAQPTSVKDNVVLWAACQPEQTSADAYFSGKPGGAFTTAFLEFYREDRCRSDIIYYARPWLKSQGFDQVPHLYCNHDKAMGMMT